jgi:hypothetical protein
MSLVKPCNVVSECVNAQVTNHKNECNEWDMEESMIHTKAAKMCECGREGKGREGGFKYETFQEQTQVKVSRIVKSKRSSVRQKEQSQEPYANPIPTACPGQLKRISAEHT